MNATRKLKLCSISLLVILGSSCSEKQDPNANHRQDVNSAELAKREGKDPKSFEKRGEDPPLTAATHFAAGRLAEVQGDTNRAIDHYWAAVKIEPRNREALFRLGVIYTQLKHYPDATVAWKLYVKAADDSADAYSNLGFCYEMAGKPTDAEDAFKKGIAKDPKNNACRVNYGLMLARDGRGSEAMIQLQAVLPPAQVHYDLASVYEHAGKKEQAKEEYRRAIAEDPSCVDAALRLAALN